MVGGVGGLQGTLAEYVAADADLLALRPKNLSAREAAGLPLSVITSWEALVDRCAIHAAQTALIHAGAGGVGHIAIQIARALGAEAYATVSSEKKSVVEKLGRFRSTIGRRMSRSTLPRTPTAKASISSSIPWAARLSTRHSRR